MSDRPASMPEQDDHDAERPFEPPALDPHQLAHVHDHPELVIDIVLYTDAPDVVLSKKRLENEGGTFESAYVVHETALVAAEYAADVQNADAQSSGSHEAHREMVWDDEGGPHAHDVIQPFDAPEIEGIEATEPMIASEFAEASARPMPFNEWRIEALNRAIERYPNTPTNYVLRGEVYLALNQHAQARADFEHALALAEGRLDELPWGYVNAAIIDRAQNGLRSVRRKPSP